MNNHSIIWKNITMIIFYVFLIIIFFILFIRFKFNIYFEINGIDSYMKLKFGIFKIEKRRKISLKIKNSTNRNTINKKGIFRVIAKNTKVEHLEIYQKIGLIRPDITAYAVPAISTLTLIPVNFLNINYDCFKYKIEPLYNELKFVLTLKAQVSFTLIKIIYSIINKFLHKLFLNARR